VRRSAWFTTRQLVGGRGSYDRSSLRSALLSALSTGALPSVFAIGVAPTNAWAAALGWLGFVFAFRSCIFRARADPKPRMLLCTIRWGDKMRATVSIQWSTPRDN
jgi:hypothetical protein